MKFNVFLLALLAILGMVDAASTAAEQAPNQAVVVKTPDEALEKLQASTLPDGVTLTGTTEKIDPPASAIAATKEAADDKDEKKEQFGWGGFGLGGWGNWGGWGGFGPYRFGFRCGGIPGWAYPLGYWNLYGAGLYGGGCGLGIPFGGLYYC